MSKTEDAVKLVKIASFLEKYNIKNATINKDLTVDVDGDVYLSGRNLNEIPFQFGRVSRYFDISYNNLTSLKGCPKYIGGNFECMCNSLTSLEGAPDYIGGYFNCVKNPKLNSLKGIGQVSGKIYSDFYRGKFKKSLIH